MLECMEVLSVAAQKRINIYSVKGAWRLDQSIQSKIIALAFSMAAEIERDLISQHGAKEHRQPPRVSKWVSGRDCALQQPGQHPHDDLSVPGRR
jgi:hypothetical protein